MLPTLAVELYGTTPKRKRPSPTSAVVSVSKKSIVAVLSAEMRLTESPELVCAIDPVTSSTIITSALEISSLAVQFTARSNF